MVAERRWCEVDGCDNYAADDDHPKCWAHYKRSERSGTGGPVRDYGRSPSERYQRAMTEWANADTDEELRRAWRNVLRAGREFHRAHGSIVING